MLFLGHKLRSIDTILLLLCLRMREEKLVDQSQNVVTRSRIHIMIARVRPGADVRRVRTRRPQVDRGAAAGIAESVTAVPIERAKWSPSRIAHHLPNLDLGVCEAARTIQVLQRCRKAESLGPVSSRAEFFVGT